MKEYATKMMHQISRKITEKFAVIEAITLDVKISKWFYMQQLSVILQIRFQQSFNHTFCTDMAPMKISKWPQLSVFCAAAECNVTNSFSAKL